MYGILFSRMPFSISLFLLISYICPQIHHVSIQSILAYSATQKFILPNSEKKKDVSAERFNSWRIFDYRPLTIKERKKKYRPFVLASNGYVNIIHSNLFTLIKIVLITDCFDNINEGPISLKIYAIIAGTSRLSQRCFGSLFLCFYPR